MISAGGVKTLALLQSDDRFNREAADGVRRMSPEMGLSLVLDVKYESGKKDFTEIVRRVEEASPGAVLIAGHQDEAMKFIPMARGEGILEPMICLSSDLTNKDFRRSLLDDGGSVFGVTYWDPNLEVPGEVFGSSRDFVEEYREIYGEEPGYHVAAGAACLTVLKGAVEEAGSLDTEKVRKVLFDLSLDTIYGRAEFNGSGQMKEGTHILRLENGVVYQVYPRKVERPIYEAPDRKDDKPFTPLRQPPGPGDPIR